MDIPVPGVPDTNAAAATPEGLVNEMPDIQPPQPETPVDPMATNTAAATQDAEAQQAVDDYDTKSLADTEGHTLGNPTQLIEDVSKAKRLTNPHKYNATFNKKAKAFFDKSPMYFEYRVKKAAGDNPSFKLPPREALNVMIKDLLDQEYYREKPYNLGDHKVTVGIGRAFSPGTKSYTVDGKKKSIKDKVDFDEAVALAAEYLFKGKNSKYAKVYKGMKNHGVDLSQVAPKTLSAIIGTVYNSGSINDAGYSAFGKINEGKDVDYTNEATRYLKYITGREGKGRSVYPGIARVKGKFINVAIDERNKKLGTSDPKIHKIKLTKGVDLNGNVNTRLRFYDSKGNEILKSITSPYKLYKGAKSGTVILN